MTLGKNEKWISKANQTQIMRQIDILEDIFTNQISVLNVAIPTTEATLDEARKICTDNNFDVHLVRCAENSDLKLYERANDKDRPLVDHEVVSESTPILDVMELLLEYPQVFVKVKRNVRMIVSRADLDSIPVRIWLFGMISILEVELRNKINNKNLSWEASLSMGRLKYAKELFDKKKDRNEEVDLLNCLQLVDLSTIIYRNWRSFQSDFVYVDRNSFVSVFKKLNILRDELAHAQKLTLDYKELYDLMKFTRECLSDEKASK
ncbi:MAG: hypothetical protein CVT94_09440 [Bacteroidetes bacterium HGW-Bacteroidetes-11]|nr:MAG: hypothetical protein CVT94_09440 [Bacteroidetes bacterium HGW-Bacteroidetes-11]